MALRNATSVKFQRRRRRRACGAVVASRLWVFVVAGAAAALLATSIRGEAWTLPSKWRDLLPRRQRQLQRQKQVRSRPDNRDGFGKVTPTSSVIPGKKHSIPSLGVVGARSGNYRTKLVGKRGGGIAAGGAQYQQKSVPVQQRPLLFFTKKDQAFLKQALLRNAMFTNLPESSLNALLKEFQKVRVPDGEVVVRQGDSPEDDDYVYVIGPDGECAVTVDGTRVPEPYGTMKSSAIFGELAVLYNKDRAATITAGAFGGGSDARQRARRGPTISNNKRTTGVILYRVLGTKFKKILETPIGGGDDGTAGERRGGTTLFGGTSSSNLASLETAQQVDDVVQQVSGTKSVYGGYIIRPYEPDRRWLWRRWTGTVLQHSYKTCLLNVLLTTIIVILVGIRTGSLQVGGTVGFLPDPSDPIMQRFQMVKKIWSYQMSLTTFILTFFVNQAYNFWLDMYGIARRIQGRLNDFHLLLATTAKRNKRTGTYTRKAEDLLDEVGEMSRLFHALVWASYAQRFEILKTEQGLRAMASRGLMTSAQLQVLLQADLPDNQKHNACVEWMMIRAWGGLEDGTLRGGEATSRMLMQQMCELRASYGTIADRLACRMPLAYTQFVQILVDSFVIMSPFALYADLGAYSVISVFIVTLFYSGLFDLAKIFLDPLDNESFASKNSLYFDLGVLVRESNAGSTRWKNAGEQLPFRV